MVNKTWLITTLFLLSFVANAQNKINLMSGVSIDAIKLEVDSEFVHFEEENKKGKINTGKIEIYRVYSYEKEGKTNIIYEQDSAHGRKWTVEQMQYFIYGEQDAKKVHKSPATTIGGMLIGSGLGFTSSYVIGFPIIALPAAFVTGFALTSTPVKVRSDKVEHSDLLKEPAYYKGYKRVAKHRKLNNAMGGTLIGTIAGVVLGIALVGS